MGSGSVNVRAAYSWDMDIRPALVTPTGIIVLPTQRTAAATLAPATSRLATTYGATGSRTRQGVSSLARFVLSETPARIDA